MLNHSKQWQVLALAGAAAMLTWSGQAAAQVVADDVVCSRCVDTSDIASRAVTTGKIANDAVTKNKIVNGAVKSRHIGPAQVVTGKLADGAVTEAKLADDAVFGRILVVRADPLDTLGNCAALQATLAGITDNDADNRYLIHLESGIYDCGATQVVMKPFVDIQGSGETATEIVGDFESFPSGQVQLASNSELRFLTVRNTAGAGGPNALSSLGATSVRVSHVTAIASGPGTFDRGIVIRGGSAILTDVTAVAQGSSGNRAISIDQGAAVEMVNFSGEANTAGTSNIGVQVVTSATLRARNSVFRSTTVSVSVGSSAIGHLASTLLEGTVQNSAATLKCVGAYDENFALLDSACSPIP